MRCLDRIEDYRFVVPPIVTACGSNKSCVVQHVRTFAIFNFYGFIRIGYGYNDYIFT